MNHILVVDDEAEIRTSLEEILREEGYGVAGAATAAEALVLLQDAPYDVVLLDIWLPDRDGLEVLSDIRQLTSETRPEVVIISGHGTIESAVKATKLGAYDFLEKPLSLDRTLIVVKNAVEARRLRSENQEFKRQFSVASVLTGESVPLKALRQQIASVSLSSSTAPPSLKIISKPSSSATATAFNPVALPSSAAPSSAPTAALSFSTKSAT
jgi:two-component system nitrogen regulation response regulator NtrX